MSAATESKNESTPDEPHLSRGRLAQLACILEVTACKPGNVHRLADLPGLRMLDFLLSATAIVEPLDRACEDGVGLAVYRSIAATRRVVNTNTNLGIVLLLAPLAAVPEGEDLAEGIRTVLEATTIDDARHVYRAIRLARPGGLGEVAEQDVASEPTAALRAVMALAANRDSVARQYANGFHEVLHEALPELRSALAAGRLLETAIVGAHLNMLARHSDSLIVRKHGAVHASDVSRRAAAVLDAGWPDREPARQQCNELDAWLRDPVRRFNPGTTADLVTAALYAALRDGTIQLPMHANFTHTYS
jgi:triphosphoribosyl-dephospho-CoA synthase